jgi:hypothetical protein
MILYEDSWVLLVNVPQNIRKTVQMCVPLCVQMGHWNTALRIGTVPSKWGHLGVTVGVCPYVCETSRLPLCLYFRLTYVDEVVSLTRRHPLPPGRFLVLISVRPQHHSAPGRIR